MKGLHTGGPKLPFIHCSGVPFLGTSERSFLGSTARSQVQGPSSRHSFSRRAAFGRSQVQGQVLVIHSVAGRPLDAPAYYLWSRHFVLPQTSKWYSLLQERCILWRPGSTKTSALMQTCSGKILLEVYGFLFRCGFLREGTVRLHFT